MSKGKLPEGVGKKIVEALKRQQKSLDDQFLDSQEVSAETNTETTQKSCEQFNFAQSETFENNSNILNTDYQSSINSSSENQSSNNLSWDYSKAFDSSGEDDLFAAASNLFKPSSVKEFEMPSNVAVLKDLIQKLPPGVNRQMGAQIIRQTLEALGISMSSVLSEAQSVQDELNESIRNCASSIQEYKQAVVKLEKQAHEYQKQIGNINELISLFIMTDKH